MVNEDKPKKRYVPVAVTAKKVGEFEGEDILKIDMPVRDDMDDYKENEKEKRREKEEFDNMTELNEAQVEKKVSEMLGKLKLQETIDKIRQKNEEIDEKMGKVDERIGEVDEKLSGKFGEANERLDKLKSGQEEIRNKQEEACTGVDCIKKDLGKIDELRGDIGKIKDIDEKLGKLNETVGAEYYKCSGSKGCNEDIKVGSSFCPNCGSKISEWESHPEWVPYWKRQR